MDLVSKVAMIIMEELKPFSDGDAQLQDASRDAARAVINAVLQEASKDLEG